MFQNTPKRWPLIVMIFIHQCIFTPGILAAPSSNLVFVLLKSGFDSEPQCAVGDNPAPQTFETKLRDMCEERCADHVTGCLRYNWYVFGNGSTLCQLYASKPTKYERVPQCNHFTADATDRLAVACPKEFTYSTTTSGCYKVLPQLQSWDNAGQGCRQMSPNTHLLVINDIQEHNVVVGLIKQALTESQKQVCASAWGYWTSGQRIDPTKHTSFVWNPFPGTMPATNVNYFNWAPNQPDFHLNSESCLHVYGKDAYLWNDASCSRQMCAVCEADQNPLLPTVLCPTGFTYMATTNKCYYMITQNMTWDEARQQCQHVDSKAHLVTIRDSVEQNTIESFIPICGSQQGNCKGTSGYFTNGQRETPGTNTPFVWKSGAENQMPLGYNNWLAGEPNSSNGAESCLMLFAENYKWNDTPCTGRMFAVCEVENH